MSFFESIFYMAWRGIAIGLIISAPMGPVGMLCIQRTLDKGRRAGLYTGIGAALSDLFYCLLTGFGLSFIEEFLERNSNIIQLAGSAVLIAFGVYLFRRNPASNLKKPMSQEISVKKNILGGFLFTFSNPLILFLIIGLFARFNFLLPEFKVYQYLTGFVFIFAGALLWWWLITFAINKVRNHFNIRSMWLINRIIGVIILLFAIVGIVTSVTALCRAARPPVIKCWNERRGFSSFSPAWDRYAAESQSTLLNNTDEDISLLTEVGGDCELQFRVRNLRSTPGKRYSYTASDGKERKTSLPPWGIALRGNDGEDLLFRIEATETAGDMISSEAALKVTLLVDGENVQERIFTDASNNIGKKVKRNASGPDPTGSLNFFKVKVESGTMKLYGGLHAPALLMEYALPSGFITDSVGFTLHPGASLSLSDIKLSTIEVLPDANELTWNDAETLKNHLDFSKDPMEGYWQVIDRSLEETLLKMGGDYRFALVKNRDGYLLLYLSGATVNSDEWIPGMTKATFTPSGIKGIWDVTWYDAMHSPLSNEIRAQRDENGTLTIQFPYHSSQLRLHPSSN